MPLRLEIVSHHRVRLGELRYKEFGVKGGTIGRSLESDWALEDSKRYLSGRHAAIDFRSGSYYIVDTSTNGVYVNDSPTPIGGAKPQRLFHGDRLRLGEYVMLVHLDDPDCYERIDTGAHVDPVERAQRVEKAAPSGYTLLSEDELSGLAVEEILSDETATDSLKAAAEAAASGLKLMDDEPTTSARTTRRPRATPAVVTDRSAAKRKPRAAVAPRAPGATQAVDRAAGRTDELPPQTALYAFMRGAGLSPRRVPAKDAAMLLHRAGQLVRELAVGLRKAIDVRVEQKNRLRIANTTIQARNNNLLKFSASVDEALENLFFAHKPEYLSAVDSVREAFDETTAHERAMLEAAHAALLGYLEQLDPDDIQQKCADGSERGLLGSLGDSSFRARYAELYAALVQHAPGHFPQRFAEALAAAYVQELAKLASASKPSRAKTG